MRKYVFRQLISDLNQKHGLELTKHICIEEVVAIFLHMIGQGASYRNT